MNKREHQRSVLAKLYKGLDEWPIEDRGDWITLHVSEIHSIFLIARKEAMDELFKRFEVEKTKKRYLAGHDK